jgi:hypothetical protein
LYSFNLGKNITDDKTNNSHMAGIKEEIITVTDVFEKYNICKDFFLYFITLYEDDFLSSWSLFCGLNL